MAVGKPMIGVIVKDEQVRIRLAQWRGEIPDRLKKVLITATKKIESTAKKSIVRGKKSGREYKRKGVTHRASAPGQPPASDLGDLLSSITSIISEVGSTVRHGLYLELGTRKMKPRPYLQPSLDKHGPKIEDAIIRELNR